jgi:ABC-type transport system involved in multi-copper enzyme maturation permease subunit
MRRFGLGPVFVYECVTAARRWQMYAQRAGAAVVLLMAVYLVWLSTVPSGGYNVSHSEYAKIGESLFYGFFSTLISVILLAAPAATAGAISIDKARGTLLHLLVTDLSNWEIVWGKLVARLLPVFGLVAVSLPVLALCTLLGGIDPEAMWIGYAVTFGVAFFGSAMALLFSVWTRKTHEALLAAYLAEVLLLLAYPVVLAVEHSVFKRTIISGSLAWTNPFVLTFSAYGFRGLASVADLGSFLAFTFGGGVLLTLIAAMRIRQAAVRFGAPARKRRKRTSRRQRRSLWPFGPKLDPNPVLWREWHRQRPTRWTKAVWLTYSLLSIAATGVLVWTQLTERLEPGLAAFATGLQVSIGLLLASVSSVTALAEERVRGSLDVLLTTPLPTRAIVWGKWRGAFRRVPLLTILPLLNVALLAIGTGRWQALGLMFAAVFAYGAWVTSLGLLLATWIKRLGLAVAASAAIYSLVTAGWLALVAILARNGRDTFEKLGCASPFFGPGELAYETAKNYDDSIRCYGALSFWAVFYCLLAAVLYWLTLLTFNRCFGRANLPRGPVRRLRAGRVVRSGDRVVPQPADDRPI